MATAVGNLVVNMSANTMQFTQGMYRVQKTLSMTTIAARGFGNALAMMTGPFAAIYGFIRLAAAGEQFNRAMRNSLAIMGDVSTYMRGRMREAAVAMAKVTAHSAEEMARAYYYLASAGLSAQQSIAALPAVARFARAGMFDLSRATELATDVQHAMGMGLKDPIRNLESLTRVTDVLVKANTLADATTEQFAETLTQKAGSAFKIVGKSIEEAAATAAVLAMRGRKGAEAGVQLSRIMIGLKSNALNNAEAFRRYNIEVYDSSGNMRHMADIIEDLEKAFGGLSDQQQQAAIESLGFTKRTSDVVAMLLGGSEELRRFHDELQRAGGMTKEVADKQLTPFQEGWAKLAAGLTSAGGAMMNLIGGPLGDLAQGLGEAVTMIGEANGALLQLNHTMTSKVLGPDPKGEADYGFFTGAFRLMKLEYLRTVQRIMRLHSLDSSGLDAYIQKTLDTWDKEVAADQAKRIPALAEPVDWDRSSESMRRGIDELSQGIDDGIQEMIEKWESQAKNIGRTPLRIKLATILEGIPQYDPEFKAMREHVTELYEALEEAARPAVDWANVWSESAEGTKRATTALAKMREELRLFGLEGRERTIAQIFDRFEDIDPNIVEGLRRTAHELDKLDKQKEKTDLADRLNQQFQGAAERFRETMDQIKDLERLGLLDSGVAGRAREAAREKLRLAEGGRAGQRDRPDFAAARQWGTREAYSALLAAKSGRSTKEQAEKAAVKTAENTDSLPEIRHDVRTLLEEWRRAASGGPLEIDP